MERGKIATEEVEPEEVAEEVRPEEVVLEEHEQEEIESQTSSTTHAYYDNRLLNGATTKTTMTMRSMTTTRNMMTTSFSREYKNSKRMSNTLSLHSRKKKMKCCHLQSVTTEAQLQRSSITPTRSHTRTMINAL